MIEQREWKWLGIAAHFICGRWCRFHLATQVGDYLISTVGEYVHPRHGKGSERAEQEWLVANWPGEDIGQGGAADEFRKVQEAKEVLDKWMAGRS